MVILERPYVSQLFLDYLAEKQIPVLSTPFSAAMGKGLNLVDAPSMRRIYDNHGRIYTTSENALQWIYDYLPNSSLIGAINIMKDKAAMRRQLQTFYPQYFFKEIAASELRALDISRLPLPLVLKPAVGFFSLGVYTINNPQDWSRALDEIEHNLCAQTAQFPDSVVNHTSFLLEEYIIGQEFAVDMYYNQAGQPVILNIMQHRFASADDVRDRLYVTSREIIDKHLPVFQAFFTAINQSLNIKNFPAHVEMRMRNGVLLPIEFNPMRFAGLCTTDIAWYAYGINTVDYYLNNRTPDFAEIMRPGKTYSMIIAEKPDAGLPAASFDYEKLGQSFQKVLEMRRLNAAELPAFAIVFTESDAEHLPELDAVLHPDFRDYLLV